MPNYSVTGEADHQWTFELDAEGHITSATGEWPDGKDDIEFQGPLPFWFTAPAHRAIRELQRAPGEEVCYYSDDSCVTCFCTPSGGMRCVKMC